MGRDQKADEIGAVVHSFNPRARMGRDSPLEITATRYLFQSTRPHGARPRPPKIRMLRRCFNPRARMGRDVASLFGKLRDRGFNPRARMGRDSISSYSRQTSYVSIHAPAWGATYCNINFIDSYGVSIHAPAWGATLSEQNMY